jgi:putative DNA primase/helicase
VIDFVAIKHAALQQALPLLREWLPHGHLERDEYVAHNPTRADKNPGSFKVNVKTGVWSDFATDDTGGDLISLSPTCATRHRVMQRAS